MNFVGLLRENFGQSCVIEFRYLEHLFVKRARQKNHLRFNLRCRDENVTPASLNVKNPIRTKNADRMMRKVRMILVKERIRITANNIRKLESELEHKTEEFNHRYSLSREMERMLEKHLHKQYENEFEKTKERHIRKLNKINRK